MASLSARTRRVGDAARGPRQSQTRKMLPQIRRRAPHWPAPHALCRRGTAQNLQADHRRRGRPDQENHRAATRRSHADKIRGRSRSRRGAAGRAPPRQVPRDETPGLVRAVAAAGLAAPVDCLRAGADHVGKRLGRRVQWWHLPPVREGLPPVAIARRGRQEVMRPVKRGRNHDLGRCLPPYGPATIETQRLRW